MHVVRRAHLYTGLFLLPWAALYAVTAFLFNHPAAFADQPTVNFGRPAVAGTLLESVPTPRETATAVAAELTRRGHAVTLVRPELVRFNRDAAFATVKADGQTVSVLVDAATGSGTVRSRVDEPAPPTPPPAAPFAVAGKPRPDAPPKRPSVAALADGVRTDNPLHERMAAALPTVLERCGFPAGELTVTSSPDVVFYLQADGRDWQATYSPLTGAVSGKPAESVTPPDLSGRQFLLRLHAAHGYPGAMDARWAWAVVVDAMAAVLLFWATSGLLMWWQVKAARRSGAVAVVGGLAAAGVLTAAMYGLLTR